MTTTVSDYVAGFLHSQGVRQVFAVPGGMIAFLLDSLHRQNQVAVIGTHHEQAAAFAAEAVGRMTGVPGVAMATSGPGAVNLLTGIGSCYFDSTPTVFITGQVNRHERKGKRAIRQLGFQETDIVTMAGPVTKAAWRAEAPEEVPQLMARAFQLALDGRPGPVLLDLPMDVQRASIDTGEFPQPCAADLADCDPAAVEAALRDMRRAKRPLILAGGGVRSARVAELMRRFVEATGVPMVNSLMAVDVLPASHPQRAGLIGTYGNRWSNLAMGRADFLLVIGSRLDVRQTGSETAAFQDGRTIYHVDCESGEMNNRIQGCHAILAHLRAFLEEALSQAQRVHLDTWKHEIAGLKQQWPDTAELTGVAGINPNDLMHQLSAASHQAAAYVADVGQHQMWAAQSLDLGEGQRFLTSGGMGAMGSGLPMAVGAALTEPGRPAVLVAGDGGFQLNIQELETIVRNRLPVKMVVLDNQSHGLVRQFQESYLEERYTATAWGYSAPDFVRVAGAYGIAASAVDDPGDLERAIEELWRNPQEPYLLHVRISPTANVYPKIAFGCPMTEMEPRAKPRDVEST